jgi:hypothetical protein
MMCLIYRDPDQDDFCQAGNLNLAVLANRKRDADIEERLGQG